MPSTLEQLMEAWRAESAQKIRKTLLNQSPRKHRKWREIAGNEALRRAPALTEQVVYLGMPQAARTLIVCSEMAHAARMDRLFAEHAE